MAEMLPMGALSMLDDETEDEAVDPSLAVMGGLSREDLKAMVVGAQKNDGLKAAYERMTQALKAQRGPSKSQMFFQIAAALGKPTRTGALGETLGNVAGALGDYTAQRDQQRSRNDMTLAELEYQQAAKSDERAQRLGVEAMKVLGKGRNGTGLANDTNQRLRLGVARNLYPNLTPEEIVEQNLLYSPEVSEEVSKFDALRAGAVNGYSPSELGITFAGKRSPSAPEEGETAAIIPEVLQPEDAANFPNAPVLKTPMGLRTNPFYKGGQ